ncbi:unnamed protein product [Cunninghamella echinulata]
MTLTNLITTTTTDTATELPITRRKNDNTLSWSSSTSSFSTSSLSSTTMSTPSTTITNATLFNPTTNSTLQLLPPPLFMNEEEEEENIVENENEEELHYILYQRWQKKITKSLTYAIATQGDTFLVERILTDDQLRPYLNINASDDKTLGTTPLIYAACFGYTTIVQLLLDAGAQIDIQDKLGWTPLMWAIANNHHSVVKLLLNQGASSTIKTTIGRTILDFIDYNNQEVIQILSPYYSTIKNKDDDDDDDHEQQQQKEFHKRIQQKQQRNAITTKLNDLRLYYQSIEHDHDHNNNNIEENDDNDDDDDDDDDKEEEEEEEKDDLHNIVLCETSMESVRHFIWDKCLPDQMFVFAEEDIPHILEIIILDLQLPMKSRQEIWVPSNVLFLCARYAHYFSSHDLLQRLLSEAISCIEDTLQKNKGDIHTLAFWIANLSQLLYYLKKDTGLVVATAVQQLEISELISETYVLLIVDSEKRMDKILEPSILDYGSNDSETIEFADDWQRFFRRRHSSRRQSSLMSIQSSSSSAHSSSNNNNNYTDNIPSLAQVAQEYQQSDTTSSPFHHYRLSTDTTYSSFQQQQQPVPSSPSSLFSVSSCTLSPHSITSLLSSILYVLQSYEVHPDIIKQAFSQFFHFMSSHLFNQILDNKKYMCRSKAMDIRMNMCTIENWVRDQQDLFHPLISYFMPLIQLLQLLQCISHIDDLDAFKNTLTMFELLNPLQIKRCVLYYRYEVDERRLPDDIEKYVTQLAKHTLNQQQQQQRRASQPPPFHQNNNNNNNNNNKKQQSSITSSSSLSRCNSSPITNIKSSEANNHHDDEFHASSPQSNASSRRQSHVSSRPTSVSSLGSLIMSKLTGTTSSSSSFMEDEKEGNNNDNNDIKEEKEENNNNNNDDDDNESFTLMHHDDILEEKRDLKYMLPFSLPASSTMVHYQSLSSTSSTTISMQRQPSKKTLIPNTTALHEVSEKIYKEVRQKLNANENEKIIKERIIIPTIPQEWMDKLDRRHESYSSSTIIKERTAMEVY